MDLFEKIVKDFTSIDLSEVTKWSTLEDTPLNTYLSTKVFSHFIENPSLPFIAVFLYLALSGPIFFTIGKNRLIPKSVVKIITIFHSFFLTVYSGWTFYNSILICIDFYQKLDSGEEYNSFLEESKAPLLYGLLCDPEDRLWKKYHLGFWITHFYISKYYEFIDTWIIQLKGIQPMFLQVYHHAGIVLIMYGFVITQNTNAGAIVLVFNSFIHTIMYTYFTFAALGYKSPLKQMLTTAQLVQFVVGVCITVPGYYIPGCSTFAQKVTLFAIHVYTIYLIKLFADFYYESYLKKNI